MLDICNCVFGWRILWHAAVNFFRCMTYYEEQPNFWVHYLSETGSALHFESEIWLFSNVTWKRSELYKFKYKYTILKKKFGNYLPFIIFQFLTSFPTFKLSFLHYFMQSKIFLAAHSKSGVKNITYIKVSFTIFNFPDVLQILI